MTTTKFTYQDYRTMPDDGKRYQVIDGELILLPTPKTRHQEILGNILHPMMRYFEDRHLGQMYLAPFDVVLSEYNVVQPDILFISTERREIITEDNVKGAPDLVVEILSESTQKLDKVTKRKLYETHGVKEYWLISPEAETVEVLTLSSGAYTTAGLFGKSHTLTSPLFADLRLPLADIFA